VDGYSDLERDNFLLLEADPTIEWYCEQPLRVRLRLGTRHVTTVFDLVVRFKDGTEEFWEVKYQADLLQLNRDSRIGRQLAAQRRWCDLNGYRYRIRTEVHIRQNVMLLNNWKFMLADLVTFDRVALNQHSTCVLTVVSGSGAATLGEVQRRCAENDPQLIRATVFHLLHQGRLRAPLDTTPITPFITLEVPNADRRSL
jgi:hypothetical protein